MTKKRILALCAVLALAPLPATANDLSEADIAALRYFLSIGDEASVNAEIRRLQKIFPGQDIQSVVSELTEDRVQIDERPMWEALNSDEYDEVRRLVREAQAEEPTYTPPDEMMTILRDRETQAQLDLAIENGDLGAALGVMKSNPALAKCDRINNPWRIAALFVAADQTRSALGVYRSILAACSEPDYVVATLQKASEIADLSEMDELFAVARAASPTSSGQMSDLETELRAGINARLNPQSVQPAAQPAPTRSGGGGPLAAAAAAAKNGNWARCLSLLPNPTTYAMHLQRSWCALNHGRPREALHGFSMASAGSGKTRREAEYGMILAYVQLGQTRAAQDLLARANLTSSQNAVAARSVYSSLAVDAFKRKHYLVSLRYLEQVEAVSKLNRGERIIQAWANFHLGRRARARAQFESIHAAAPGSDTQRALRAISR